MSEYNIFQAIYMSFYSKKLYRDVAINWGGKTFLYLLFIIALSWILFTYLLQHALNETYKHSSDKIVQQIPVVTLKDGKVSTPENRPYEITDPTSHEKIAIIDTSGKYTTLEQAKTTILITQTQIITQPKPGETKINQIPANLNLVIDPVVVKGYVGKFLGFTWIVFFIGFMLGAFVFRIIQALLYALIGKIIGPIFGLRLQYYKIFQIAMVSITPAFILYTILFYFDVSFPYQALVYFILAMIYLFYGMSANRELSVAKEPKG